jgi:osmoprotectant transport system permease protein
MATAMSHFSKPPSLVILVLAAWLLLANLPLVSLAPNRLLSGQGQSLWQVLETAGALWQAGILTLAVALFVCLVGLCLQNWQKHCAALILILLVFGVWALTALSGQFATVSSTHMGGLGRISLSSGFWLVMLVAWLAANDALRRVRTSTLWASLYWLVVLAGLLGLISCGALDGLSSLKEYANRQEDFWRAFGQHIHIIALTTGVTMVIGLPLGVAIHRHPSWAKRIFPLLNLVQTIPSIALFGLLIAVLAWLGKLFPLLPAWGIQGIGLAPAVLALTLYSLLPLVRSVREGLSQLPQAVTESGKAMGLSNNQLFWQVELPLAFPVILSGLKVMLIQTIGLTAVAALIGAGGLGALMFEGLFSSALDLVVLAVIPIVVLTWFAEAFFMALTAMSHQWTGRVKP